MGPADLRHRGLAPVHDRRHCQGRSRQGLVRVLAGNPSLAAAIVAALIGALLLMLPSRTSAQYQAKDTTLELR